MFTSWRNPVTRPLEEKYLGNDIENILEKALTDNNSGQNRAEAASVKIQQNHPLNDMV